MTLSVSGCGGGSGGMGSDPSQSASRQESLSSVEATPGLTKTVLIKRGDEICEATDKNQEADLKAYMKEKPDSQSTKAGREDLVLTAGLPPIQTEIEELAALGAPPGDEEEVEAILKGIEAAAEKGEGDPVSLLTENSKNPFIAVGKLAAAYGFKVCDSPL